MKVRVASAGTGKTTSLVRRYLELVAAGTPMRRIAGVTFTRVATGELRQRVGAGLREILETGAFLDLKLHEPERSRFEEARLELDGATLSTIHGFMITALRLVAPQMGLDPDFSVLGEWEAEALFEEELKTLLYLAREPAHGLHGVLARLGPEATPLLLHLFKGRSLAERYDAEGEENQALLALYEAVYARYRIRLGASLLPPSEVERRALVLVRTKAALARLAARYRVVLVDEFQDVNPLQGRFFEALEVGGLEVEVVGDPKQSIYGFRHADVDVFRRALAGGEVQLPLDQTRRHAQVVTRFLNHLTRSFAEKGLGFGPEEAPDVTAAGAQAEKGGRVELHWVAGEAPVGKLRACEARLLAERLRALHEEGYAYSQMAVLARSYTGLAQVEDALREGGLPYVLLQGRGYFERLEVRDLYHALRVGIDPSGLSLAAWLRGPFAGLELPQIDTVLAAESPLATLEAVFPEVFGRLERIRRQVRGTPLGALKFLIREPFIDGKRYVDFLEPRARENVDALLFTVAEAPPGEIELLLDRLELLSRQADAGDVPQSGEGIALLTVHRAKGLEWPVVAVFDLGRKLVHQAQPLYIEPARGLICRRDAAGSAAEDRAGDTADWEAIRSRVIEREAQESYRLLYVAASRARDVLVMSGSIKGERPDGWAAALAELGLGAGERGWSRPDFVLKTWPYQPVRPGPKGGAAAAGLQASPWLERSFASHPFPPVHSPSRLKGERFEASHEPLPLPDPDEGELLPGRARTVGTLVHYAISQNWSAKDPKHLENLQAQEVMFPFDEAEQQDILGEVKALLTNYQALLGKPGGLPALAARSADCPELPMALPQGATVWQGIIDRLYCVDGRWYLEDYKTDQQIEPERYHFQLAVYLKAIQAVRGVTPRVRLVYLRPCPARVVEITPQALEQALLGVEG